MRKRRGVRRELNSKERLNEEERWIDGVKWKQTERRVWWGQDGWG